MTGKDFENTPQAKEIKKLACEDCYTDLINWISGVSHIPFVPCDSCAPKLQTWLENRLRNRG